MFALDTVRNTTDLGYARLPIMGFDQLLKRFGASFEGLRRAEARLSAPGAKKVLPYRAFLVFTFSLSASPFPNPS